MIKIIIIIITLLLYHYNPNKLINEFIYSLVQHVLVFLLYFDYILQFTISKLHSLIKLFIMNYFLPTYKNFY